MGIRVFPKLRVLSSETFDLEKIATARQPSQVLSTYVDSQCDKLATVIGRQFITVSIHLCV